MSEKRIYRNSNGKEIEVYISKPFKTSTGYYVNVDVLPRKGHLRMYFYKEKRERIAYFEGPKVRSPYKRQGIGSALINVAKGYAIEKGTTIIKGMALLGEHMPNEETKALWKIYEKAGFKEKDGMWRFEVKK